MVRVDLARPPQQTHRIPGCCFLQDLLQQIPYIRIDFFDPFSSSTCSPRPTFPRTHQLSAASQLLDCFGNRRPRESSQCRDATHAAPPQIQRFIRGKQPRLKLI